MALLPSTAKFLLWNSNDDVDENTKQSISVSDLLKNLRDYTPPESSKELSPLIISYDELAISDENFLKISDSSDLHYEMTCGPYEYGAPLEAASMALQACSDIKKQFTNKGVSLNVHFLPTAEKGQASIKAIRINEANDA